MADPFAKVTPEFLKEASKVLASLPPPERKVIKDIPTYTCICGKQVPVTQLETMNTGVFITYGDACKDCKDGKEFARRTATLVCAKCRRVIMHVRPYEDKTGFRFEAGKVYHMEGCAICDLTGRERFPIIEKALWNRTHGIAPKPTSKITS